MAFCFACEVYKQSSRLSHPSSEVENNRTTGSWLLPWTDLLLRSTSFLPDNKLFGNCMNPVCGLEFVFQSRCSLQQVLTTEQINSTSIRFGTRVIKLSSHRKPYLYDYSDVMNISVSRYTPFCFGSRFTQPSSRVAPRENDDLSSICSWDVSCSLSPPPCLRWPNRGWEIQSWFTPLLLSAVVSYIRVIGSNPLR